MEGMRGLCTEQNRDIGGPVRLADPARHGGGGQRTSRPHRPLSRCARASYRRPHPQLFKRRGRKPRAHLSTAPRRKMPRRATGTWGSWALLFLGV